MYWNVCFYCAESEQQFTVLFQVSHKPTYDEVQNYINSEFDGGVTIECIDDGPTGVFKIMNSERDFINNLDRSGMAAKGVKIQTDLFSSPKIHRVLVPTSVRDEVKSIATMCGFKLAMQSLENDIGSYSIYEI